MGKLKEFILEQGRFAKEEMLTVSNVKKTDKSGDITTEVDYIIEKRFQQFVIEDILKTGLLPETEVGISGEELGDTCTTAEYKFCIDPIDGTKFYAQQVPLWSLTCALVHKNTTLLAIVYNPSSDQLYYAISDEGAYLNDRRLEYLPEPNFRKATIAWDTSGLDRIKDAFSHLGLDQEASTKNAVELFKKYNHAHTSFVDTFYRVRDFGVSPLAISWLCHNGISGYVSPCRTKAKMIDIIPAILLAKEAGATISEAETSAGMVQVIIGSPQFISTAKSLLDQPSSFAIC